MQDLQELLSVHGGVHPGWILWQKVRKAVPARDHAMGLVRVGVGIQIDNQARFP